MSAPALASGWWRALDTARDAPDEMLARGDATPVADAGLLRIAARSKVLIRAADPSGGTAHRARQR